MIAFSDVADTDGNLVHYPFAFISKSEYKSVFQNQILEPKSKC